MNPVAKKSILNILDDNNIPYIKKGNLVEIFAALNILKPLLVNFSINFKLISGSNRKVTIKVFLPMI